MLTGGQIRLEVLEENTNVVRHRGMFHPESLISVSLEVTLSDNYASLDCPIANRPIQCSDPFTFHPSDDFERFHLTKTKIVQSSISVISWGIPVDLFGTTCPDLLRKFGILKT